MVPTRVPTVVGTGIRSGKGAAAAGSIPRRPDKGPDAYELRVFLWRDASGRDRHRGRPFHGTKRAAERELARLVVTQEDETEVVPDEPARRCPPAATVNDAIAGWRANGWDDLSPVTVRRYEDVWKRHSARGIGKRRSRRSPPTTSRTTSAR